MSKFSIGTLVMMKAPANYIRATLAPPDGSIGEVVDAGQYAKEMAVGCVCVDFPAYPSDTTTKWWAVPTTFLIPLSDPGLADNISKEDDFDKKYEEEYDGCATAK